tara:strand:+ start:869 stop:1132 length:264 start_codon:yes stop_codon:yes gene_type:complete
MDEIYQEMNQSDYDYIFITDPYIVKVIENINENFPPSKYPITDRDILEDRLAQCGFYDIDWKSFSSKQWMDWTKSELWNYFNEKGGE